VAASGCPPEAAAAPRPVRLVRLKRRPEFLAAARGAKAGAAAFLLQACPRPDEPGTAGIGFTVTRRLGGAVVRNRARRRLREAVRSLPETSFAPGWNYVVVARGAALTCPFSQLRTDLEACLRRLPIG
jgi:ribonuclease P protein component